MDLPSSSGRQPPARLTPLGRGERSALPAVAVILLFLALAIVKPWAALSPTGARTGPNSAAGLAHGPAPVRGEHGLLPALATTTPGAAVGHSSLLEPADPPGSIRCLSPDSWRLVTDQQTIRGEVRTWIVAIPVSTRTPLDPDVAPIVLGGDLMSVGLCAPWSQSGQGPWTEVAPRFTGLWRLTGDAAATALTPRPIDPQAAPTPSAAPSATPSPSGDQYDGPLVSAWSGRLAVLYGAPAPKAGAEARPTAGLATGAGDQRSWPAGHYVVAVEPPGTETSLFFAFQVTSQLAP